MIQFDKVSKVYEQPVFGIEKLKLERNIYWLTGNNGSGKTTFLRMLAGMIPFEGEIFLDDVSLRQFPLKYRRMVSFAEAEPAYPDFITGNELIKFYAEVREADATQTEMLIYLFKMKDFIANTISTYSSGMIKKLSLLLAFIGKPSLILLDEPLATLDENTIQKIPDLINAYHQEFKTSFIFSSHQPFHSGAFLKTHQISIKDQGLQLSA